MNNKERIIGEDADEEQKSDELSVRNSNKPSHLEFDVIHEEIDEDKLEEEMDLPQKIFTKIYLSIVDRMAVNILNSSFYDIRVGHNYEGVSDDMISDMTRKITREVAQQAYTYCSEEEE